MRKCPECGEPEPCNCWVWRKRGQARRKSNDPDPNYHVHKYVFQGYDYSMQKNYWKCSCNDAVWAEQGEDPNA